MQVTHCAKAKRCILEKSQVSHTHTHTPDASRSIQATVQNGLFNHQTDISLLQEWTYLLTYSSSSPMGHKASMSTLHCIRSLAACWASPHDRFICSSSCVTVLRQVVLGLPGFLLPGGVHLKAIFVMRSCAQSLLSPLLGLSRQPIFYGLVVRSVPLLVAPSCMT